MRFSHRLLHFSRCNVTGISRGPWITVPLILLSQLSFETETGLMGIDRHGTTLLRHEIDGQYVLLLTNDHKIRGRAFRAAILQLQRHRARIAE